MLEEYSQLTDSASESCCLHSIENGFSSFASMYLMLSANCSVSSFIPHYNLTEIQVVEYRYLKKMEHDSWKHIFEYWLKMNSDTHCIPLAHRTFWVSLHSKVYRKLIYYSIDFGEKATEIFKSGIKGKHKKFLFILFKIISFVGTGEHISCIKNWLLQETFSTTIKHEIYLEIRESALTFCTNLLLIFCQNDGLLDDKQCALAKVKLLKPVK